MRPARKSLYSVYRLGLALVITFLSIPMKNYEFVWAGLTAIILYLVRFISSPCLNLLLFPLIL